jgi:hypothetical protein
VEAENCHPSYGLRYVASQVVRLREGRQEGRTKGLNERERERDRERRERERAREK